MNCGKCGQPLEQGAAFCGNCGQQILLPPQPSPAPITQQTTPVPSPVPMAPAAPSIAPATPAIPPAIAAPVASTAQPTSPLAAPVPAAVPLGVSAIPAAAPVYATPAVASTSNQPLVAMIVGIVALLLSFSLLGLPLAITAIVLGSLGMKKGGNKGMAIAGLVLGIISIVIFSVLFILGVMAGVQEAQKNNGFILPVLDLFR